MGEAVLRWVLGHPLESVGFMALAGALAMLAIPRGEALRGDSHPRC